MGAYAAALCFLTLMQWPQMGCKRCISFSLSRPNRFLLIDVDEIGTFISPAWLLALRRLV